MVERRKREKKTSKGENSEGMDDLDGGAMRLREMGKGVWILGGFFVWRLGFEVGDT